MPEQITVAFLGLGHMGGPMAVNLVRAGYTVAGFDVVPAALDAAQTHGVPTVASPLDAIAGADVVLTMFPSGQHVLDAYRGAEGQPGLLAEAKPGTMFLDCSTINVDEAREASALAIAAGHRAVDAPVSGGVVGAEAGTLTFMVGGEPARLRGRSAAARGDGKTGGPLRRTRRRPGRENLQQPHPGGLHDRGE